jgi:hypothetical protein
MPSNRPESATSRVLSRLSIAGGSAIVLIMICETFSFFGTTNGLLLIFAHVASGAVGYFRDRPKPEYRSSFGE